MDKDKILRGLIDDIGDNECPVCKITQRSVDQYVYETLYDEAADPGPDAQPGILDSLCDMHIWLFQNNDDPMVHLTVYGSILKDVVSKLQVLQNSDDPRLRLDDTVYAFLLKDALSRPHAAPASGKIRAFPRTSANARQKAPCPLCRLENECEKSFLKGLDNHIVEDQELQWRFDESGILCFPHLRKFIAMSSNSKGLNLVLNIVVSRYNRLLSRLSKLRNKKADQKTEISWSFEERATWAKLIKIVVGNRLYYE